MRRLSDLRLNTKINLILSSLLLVLFILAVLLAYRQQRTLILNVALEHARAIARQIIETRNYMASAVRDEPESNYALVPEVVATRVAKRLTTGSPIYVRQVSLRYRNPENRPDPYEARELKEFAFKTTNEAYDAMAVEGERVFRYIRAMSAEESCLNCHGPYEEAPRFVQERFPPGHPSYNYEVGEVIGAVSVMIPLAETFQDIGRNLTIEILYRLAVLALVFLLMAFLIRRFVIAPIRLASTTIRRVAETGNLAERIPVQPANDEIGELIFGFNEMMGELERTDLQRRESEDRYRNLIDAADAAIVTILENGNIVIANRQAERLIGLSRNELLGRTIFEFVEDGDLLREKLQEHMRGELDWKREIFTNVIRHVDGKSTGVETTMLLASRTDRHPLFTVLFKEKKA